MLSVLHTEKPMSADMECRKAKYYDFYWETLQLKHEKEVNDSIIRTEHSSPMIYKIGENVWGWSYPSNYVYTLDDGMHDPLKR